MSVGQRHIVTAVLGLLVAAACKGDEDAAATAAPLPGPQVEEAPPRAHLATFEGEVAVKRAAGDAWVGATAAMVLFENDKVRTARGARAQIRFASGSLLAVGEDALVGIAEARPPPGQHPADITVLKGRIDAELTDSQTQSLTVSTPGATVRAGREIVFQ